jgi:hypothetical protein
MQSMADLTSGDFCGVNDANIYVNDYNSYTNGLNICFFNTPAGQQGCQRKGGYIKSYDPFSVIPGHRLKPSLRAQRS